MVPRFFAANTMQSNSGQFVRVEEYEKLMAVVKQLESDNRKLRQTVTELAIQLHEAKKHNNKPKQSGGED